MSQIPPSEWGGTSEDPQHAAGAPSDPVGSETPAATDEPGEESPPGGYQAEQGERLPAGHGQPAPPHPAGGYGQAPPHPAGAYGQGPTPYGAPTYGQPYGAPTYGQPYGGPTYGQPYGQAPPPNGGYGQAPPPNGGYGQAPPPYGSHGQAPPPNGGYGQAPPPYGSHGQAGYGAPPYGQGYGVPRYGAPPGSLPPPYGWSSGPDAGRYGYPAAGAGTLAGYGPRLVAFVLDALVVGVPVAIITAAGGLGRFGEYSLDAAVAFAYATLLIGGATAQTIGMRVMKIGVAEASNRGSPVGYRRAAGRAGVALLIGLIVFIGPLVDLLWPLWDPMNQTLHDKAAGTVVLRR